MSFHRSGAAPPSSRKARQSLAPNKREQQEFSFPMLKPKGRLFRSLRHGSSFRSHTIAASHNHLPDTTSQSKEATQPTLLPSCRLYFSAPAHQDDPLPLPLSFADILECVQELGFDQLTADVFQNCEKNVQTVRRLFEHMIEHFQGTPCDCCCCNCCCCLLLCRCCRPPNGLSPDASCLPA